MADTVTTAAPTPEVSAALDDMKVNVTGDTVSSGVMTAVGAGGVAHMLGARNKTLAAVATVGAVAGGMLGHHDAKLRNQPWDDIANNPDPVSRKAALEKQKANTGLATGAGVVVGGGTAAMGALLATEGRQIGRAGKAGIIAGSIALGATAVAGITHHYSEKRNHQIARLDAALDRQDTIALTHAQRILQEREAAAHASAGAKR